MTLLNGSPNSGYGRQVSQNSPKIPSKRFQNETSLYTCIGKRIDVAIYGYSIDNISKDCNTKKKPQISPGMIIWNTQDLGDNCKKTLFDPDIGLTVSVRAHEWSIFCPKKVELEILDIFTNEPRYFCSQMINRSGYTLKTNTIRHDAKEERCVF